MLSLRSVRQFFVIGLIAIGAISFGLKLHAQQGGGLTPPPKPTAPQSPTAAIATDGAPFVVGERLLFNVTWLNFPTAARLEMEVAEQGQFFGQESFQIKTKVETTGRVRSLFTAIDDQYISYINPNTAVPFRVVNLIRQGQKQAEETVILDQNEQQAIYTDGTKLPIPSGIYDLPSILYGLRLRPLPQGEKIKLSALYGKEIVEIDVEVKARERITTQAGNFNTICIKVSPQKRFSKYRTTLWLTDDSKKLPVLLSANLPFGDVRAELASATITARPSPALGKLKVLTDESGSPGINGTNGKHGRESSLPFAIGEKLNYDISWGNFASVGKASFEVRQQGMLGSNRVFELYGEATTRGAAQTLINVNDQLSSFVLIDKLIPLRTDLRLREGRRNKQVTAIYNSTNNTATLSNGTVVAVSPGTLDLVSLFYAIRASEMKIGAIYNLPFLDANHRLRVATIRVVKQETIDGPTGQRDSWQLDILIGQTLIAQAWVSNDTARLPLYIATRTQFGELRFILTSTINTK
jgi:Protein of unknown function (DUF3108)